MKTGFYMRAGDDQFSGWTEKKLQSTSLPKPDLHQKKVMVTVGWSASGLMHYSFLNPGETVTSEKYTEQFSETHRKPQCLQLPLVNRKGPVLSSTQMHITQPTHPKLNRLGSKVCLICHIHLTSRQLTTQASRQLFAGKLLPQPARGRKCFWRVCWISKHKFLCYRNKQTHFSLVKNVLIVMVPTLISKDVFEPNYNDLKFTVQNCDYFCTNLVEFK